MGMENVLKIYLILPEKHLRLNSFLGYVCVCVCVCVCVYICIYMYIYTYIIDQVRYPSLSPKERLKNIS